MSVFLELHSCRPQLFVDTRRICIARVCPGHGWEEASFEARAVVFATTAHAVAEESHHFFTSLPSRERDISSRCVRRQHLHFVFLCKFEERVVIWHMIGPHACVFEEILISNCSTEPLVDDMLHIAFQHFETENDTPSIFRGCDMRSFQKCLLQLMCDTVIVEFAKEHHIHLPRDEPIDERID